MNLDERKRLFLEKSIKAHGGKYSYEKVDYVNSSTKVCIICPKHGEFWKIPTNHTSGQGCPKCARRKLTTEDVIKLFKKAHGDTYDYSKFRYTKMHAKSTITCKEHGDFLQTPFKHLEGQGCMLCGIDKRSKSRIKDTVRFIRDARKVHGSKYSYDETEYVGVRGKVKITCHRHGYFYQTPNDHLNGHGCPMCGHTKSNAEIEIFGYLKSIGIETQQNVVGKLKGKQEIDLLNDELGIGVEYDGLKWHSSEFKDKGYHIRKTNDCESVGIKLIHIFEDEWTFKKEIVKSILCNLFKKTNNVIHSNKCDAMHIEGTEKREFLKNNHIVGDCDCDVSIGLLYNGELMSIACFKKIDGQGKYVLARYCSKLFTVVVGGLSKLLNKFLTENYCASIVTYCDKRYFDGHSFLKLGFALKHTTEPNKFYVYGTNKQSRKRYISNEHSVNEIYDCGDIVFELDCNKPINSSKSQNKLSLL